ncbi:MAG TPA: GNAT family N-acetyltransferase [Polyangiaceae bacterium]|nr:GNAT family N-acetyltransferase [Polyangiaceae bacterium]
MHADRIQTDRLELVPMTPAFLEASLRGDREHAERLIAASVPAEWVNAAPVARRRLAQLQADPTLQPWLLRAVVSRSEPTMIGHVGFHTRPGEKYLDELAPGGVEFGYTIFEKWRRRGYAREAAEGLMDWALHQHGVTRFVLSISPTNVASLGLAQRLEFRKIGSHIDDEDGPEDIFERHLELPRSPGVS